MGLMGAAAVRSLRATRDARIALFWLYFFISGWADPINQENYNSVDMQISKKITKTLI
jgi:hypothetical protein